jgi:DNA-binding LacI/PurR family transcriptional regulator
LVAAGHSRVAFLGWHEGSAVGDDRCAGWTRALADAGLDPTGLRSQGEDGMAQGRSAALALEQSEQPPTAYVCVSDSIAAGALSALSDLGRPAGPDRPVIGFDDTPVAAALGLSSCAQPLSDVAARCVDVLNALMRAPSDAQLPPTHVLLEPQVVVRATGGQS